jgi:hypothetical protein
MTATELQLQQGLQAVVQGLDEFDDRDVVINDWAVLDRPVSEAPFLVFINADEFDSRQVTMTATTGYTVKAWLIVYLGGREWEDAYNEFRDVRQAIIDKFNAVGTARTAGGIDGVNVPRIYNLSEIGFIYAQGQDPELTPDALPEYLAQMIAFEVEQF